MHELDNQKSKTVTTKNFNETVSPQICLPVFPQQCRVAQYGMDKHLFGPQPSLRWPQRRAVRIKWINV
jgi:hypothetical protein